MAPGGDTDSQTTFVADSELRNILMSNLSRRRFLAAAGTATLSSLAGCERHLPSAPREPEMGDDRDVIHVSKEEGSSDGDGSEAHPLETISAGIDLASAGDTVQVHADNHEGNVDYEEIVEIDDGGAEGKPLTLTGPSDAILRPPSGKAEHPVLSIDASYVHIDGLTITGLLDRDAEHDPESYHRNKLIELNKDHTAPDNHDHYLEGLRISPDKLGYSYQSLINAAQIKDSVIGEFKVHGPAGTKWILDDCTAGHNGEIVYLGTSPNNRPVGYDKTRNIRVHHIDNSDGHPHSELVDCKVGTENVTIEYCTDCGGVQSHASRYKNAVTLDGRGHTVRWNVINGVEGDAVRIGPQTFQDPEPPDGVQTPDDDDDNQPLPEPETDFERSMGKDHAVYGNVFTGYTQDAVNFLRESHHPRRASNPKPRDQRILCGNLFDAYSDAALDSACTDRVPQSEGVGHLAGSSPWERDAPSQEEVFDRKEALPHLDGAVRREHALSGQGFLMWVTVSNTASSDEEVDVWTIYKESERESETTTIAGNSRRSVTIRTDGYEDTGEVSVMIGVRPDGGGNGEKCEHERADMVRQKIGSVRIIPRTME